MEDAARYADEIAIMHEGRCVLTGAPRELFANTETLQTYRLQLPRIVKFQHRVEKMILDERLGAIPSLSSAFLTRVGMPIEEYLEN